MGDHMKADFVRRPAPFAVGDLIRDKSDSNANTIYKVLFVRPLNQYEWKQWQITVRPVFGLFKQDYKLNKNIGTGGGYVKVTMDDLYMARHRLNDFIKETSGEIDLGA